MLSVHVVIIFPCCHCLIVLSLLWYKASHLFSPGVMALNHKNYLLNYLLYLQFLKKVMVIREQNKWNMNTVNFMDAFQQYFYYVRLFPESFMVSWNGVIVFQGVALLSNHPVQTCLSTIQLVLCQNGLTHQKWMKPDC